MLDSVEALLAIRGDARSADTAAVPERFTAELNLEDVMLVARRHFENGQRSGHRIGYRAGRAASISTADAVLTVVSTRLKELQDLLAPPVNCEDKRSRKQLREQACLGLDAIRAGIAVVGVKVQEGAV